MNTLLKIITVAELDLELQGDAPPIVLDVREVEEIRARPFKGARTIPLGQLSTQINELDASANIVTLCVSGRRSLMACHLLGEAGFAKVRNLDGGINAWDAYCEALSA